MNCSRDRWGPAEGDFRRPPANIKERSKTQIVRVRGGFGREREVGVDEVLAELTTNDSNPQDAAADLHAVCSGMGA